MSKKIEISTSSLVSLKAELARKQEEVNRAKSEAKNTFAQLPAHPKKQSIFSKKNAGVDSRNEKDYEEFRKDEDDLKKSRTALEAKTKLYDQLSQQLPSTETDDGRYLVNFEQKSRDDQKNVSMSESEDDEHFSDDANSDPDDDWVEYQDCLGRTRKCLRRDLGFLKDKDAKLAESLSLGREPDGGSAVVQQAEDVPATQPELMSAAAAKREQLRQKWEEEELRLRDKVDVHYQDVLFDEARAHGVGYYGFSSDEAQRRAQQEALAKLRQDTAAKQQLAQEARLRRQHQLSTRLRAARNRQRARQGLPPQEEEPEKPAAEEEVENPADGTGNPQPEQVPQKSAEPPKKVAKVRPWDIGKQGVKEQQVMSQEEWVKLRRDERPQEFAPPCAYQEDAASSSRQHKAPKKASRGKLFQKSRPEESSPDVCPEQAGEAAHPEDDELLGPEPTMYFTTKRHKQDAPRTGAEIAPPPTYEYYGPPPTASGLRKGMDKRDMESSIVAGLKYLRQQADDKEAQREKGLLPIV